MVNKEKENQKEIIFFYPFWNEMQIMFISEVLRGTKIKGEILDRCNLRDYFSVSNRIYESSQNLLSI